MEAPPDHLYSSYGRPLAYPLCFVVGTTKGENMTTWEETGQELLEWAGQLEREANRLRFIAERAASYGPGDVNSADKVQALHERIKGVELGLERLRGKLRQAAPLKL